MKITLPMKLAVKSGNVALIKRLFDRHHLRESIDSDGNNILMMATNFGNVELCQHLLSMDYDLTDKNHKDQTVLQIAQAGGLPNHRLIQVLLENLSQSNIPISIRDIEMAPVFVPNSEKPENGDWEAEPDVGIPLDSPEAREIFSDADSALRDALAVDTEGDWDESYFFLPGTRGVKGSRVIIQGLDPWQAEQKLGVQGLIAQGREEGYLTYGDLSDHLPQDITYTEYLEEIVQDFDDIGITVCEVIPISSKS